MNVRIYKPMGEGGFADLLVEMRENAWTCEPSDTGHSATCTKDTAKVKLVADYDMFRVQLLAGPDSTWSALEKFFSHVSGCCGDGTLWGDDPAEMHGDGVYRKTVGSSGDKQRTYGPYTTDTAKTFLDKVKSYGMSVTGNNPWHIDANKHGVTLDASRDDSGKVTLTVTGRNFYVSLATIWQTIDPLMPHADVSGDVSTRWEELSEKMKRFDIAIGDELRTSDGLVIGVVGEDWTPPISTDPKAHIEFLERTAERIKDGLDRAKTLPAAAAGKVKRTASDALDTATELAKDVNYKLGTSPLPLPSFATPEIAQAWKERANKVEETLDETWQDVKTGAKWYVGAIAGVAVGWWVVVGIGAYLYFSDKRGRAAA